MRAFLREWFPGSEVIGRFDVEATAQRFTVNPSRSTRHTLMVPHETLEGAGVTSLLTERVVEAMKRAGARPVTLRARGIRY